MTEQNANQDNGIMLTKENGGVEFYGYLQAVYRLATEVKTGMKASRGVSSVQVAKNYGLVSEGTRGKKKALREAVAKMKELYPEWEPKPSVQAALDS